MTPGKDREFDPFDYESIFEEDNTPETWADRLPVDPEKLKKYALRIVVPLLALLLVFFGIKQFFPGGGLGPTVEVSIPAGASTGDVAALLKQEHVIPDAITFRLWAKMHGGVSFQAGKYNFNKNSSDSTALSVLKHGPKANTDRITIPEGFRLGQIAQRVGEIPGMSAAKFLQVAQSGVVRSGYEPQDSNDLEGFLFPDTYSISSSDTEQTLLQRMVTEFDSKARSLGLDNAATAVGNTPYETLIIASMIESEAKVPDDRGKISRVIQNRLFQNMPLQIDSTVLYALGNTKQTLTSSDLKVRSPYNTYVVSGLPPGPIDNPGAASIQAALNPTPGNWLYYVVTSADGSHSFSATYAEQQQNIQLAKQRGVLK